MLDFSLKLMWGRVSLTTPSDRLASISLQSTVNHVLSSRIKEASLMSLSCRFRPPFSELIRAYRTGCSSIPTYWAERFLTTTGISVGGSTSASAVGEEGVRHRQ